MYSKFQQESNWIEGLQGSTGAENRALVDFVQGPPTVEALRQYVAVCQPDAVLRNHVEVPDVRVGNYVAPASGPMIERRLENILVEASELGSRSLVHKKYETLHPFTDGNGRSGRALWLWMFWRQEGWTPTSFLRWWYYDSLREYHG